MPVPRRGCHGPVSMAGQSVDGAGAARGWPRQGLDATRIPVQMHPIFSSTATVLPHSMAACIRRGDLCVIPWRGGGPAPPAARQAFFSFGAPAPAWPEA
jgi:hypothetical protein